MAWECTACGATVLGRNFESRGTLVALGVYMGGWSCHATDFGFRGALTCLGAYGLGGYEPLATDFGPRGARIGLQVYNLCGYIPQAIDFETRDENGARGAPAQGYGECVHALDSVTTLEPTWQQAQVMGQESNA